MKTESIKAYTSSKSGEWQTPPKFYKALDDEFHFTLDPAATKENHKCEKYFTVEDNGLNQSWIGERVFLNPPYGDWLPIWMKKVTETIKDARDQASDKQTIIVCLISARTDSTWWQEHVAVSNEVRSVYHRIDFIDGITGKAPGSPLFPSAVVIFDSMDNCKTAVYHYMDRSGNVWRMNVWGERDYVRQAKKE